MLRERGTLHGERGTQTEQSPQGHQSPRRRTTPSPQRQRQDRKTGGQENKKESTGQARQGTDGRAGRTATPGAREAKEPEPSPKNPPETQSRPKTPDGKRRPPNRPSKAAPKTQLAPPQPLKSQQAPPRGGAGRAPRCHRPGQRDEPAQPPSQPGWSLARPRSPEGCARSVPQ